MDNIKIYEHIRPVHPVMVAGWPGMGSVALSAIDFLKRALAPKRFAEIELGKLTMLDSVNVANGIASLPQPPKNIFYYSEKHNLVIFEGEAQIPGQGGIFLLNRVLSVAALLRVSRIFTGAAYPVPSSYRDPSHLYGAVNKKEMLVELQRFGVMPMKGGHISGLNGMLLGFAREKDVDAACLLATIPHYAMNLVNPKASAAIVEALFTMLRISADLGWVESYIKEVDEKMAPIEDKVKELMPVDLSEGAAIFPAEANGKIPPYIMAKLERLFEEARSDKNKAKILKRELDRWDLYGMFEDRFLDLFKDTGTSS